jgi:dTDP-glucose 4,6-dehydratase
VHSVPDRLGHDRRYALDRTEAFARGWPPQVDFARDTQPTLGWHTNQRAWREPIKDGTDFREYYRTQYEDRLARSTP